MDPIRLRTHEIRFINPKPRAIHCLAHEPSSDRLAVVRNHSLNDEEPIETIYYIEIWNLREQPVLECTIHLPKEWSNSIECICWRSRNILLVGGMHGHVLVIHAQKAEVLMHVAAVSGPVWCMCIDQTRTSLAVGTEDGFISLFSTENEQEIQYQGALEPKGGRILSVSWHPNSQMLAASSIGRLWLWDAVKRQFKREMRPPRRGKKEPLVSSVLFLRDDVIVSGDSNGATIFWDANFGTPLATFQAHKAGILSMALRRMPDGHERVYSTGIDPIITSFRHVEDSVTNVHTWQQTYDHYRYHTHDVRALCAAGPYLVSGGIDSFLCIVRNSPKEVLKIPSFSDVTGCLVRDTFGTPLMLTKTCSDVDIWCLAKIGGQVEGNGDVIKSDYHHLLQYGLGRGNNVVHAAALSPDGRYFAVSSSNGTKVYQLLLPRNLNALPDVHIAPVEMNLDLDQGKQPCRLMCFGAGNRLFMASSRTVSIKTIQQPQETSKLKQADDVSFEAVHNEDDAIRMMSISKSGNHLVLVTHRRRIMVLDLQTVVKSKKLSAGEDEEEGWIPFRRWETTTGSLVAALVISGEKSNVEVLVSFADGSVAAWSPVANVWTKIHQADAVYHAVSIGENLALLHGWSKGLFLIRDGREGKWTVKKEVDFDQYVLQGALLSDGELVKVTQLPWKMMNLLPPAMAKKVFGM